MSSFRGVRDALKSIVPNWLSNRLENNTGFKILYSAALMCDAIIETMLEGYRAPMPGKGTPTADGLIGQSRGILRGATETDIQYEERLQQWLTLWQNAGSDATLAKLIQTYLGNNLVVRVIDRRSNFTTVFADGSTERINSADWSVAWDWDTQQLPERANWWSDIWIVVYIDNRWYSPTDLTDVFWGIFWGSYQGAGTGHSVDRKTVDAILNIVATFKGAHTWVEAIIWTTDTTLFDPRHLDNTGNPLGDWGNWSKYTGTPMRYIPARNNLSTRYWVPNQGG